MWGKSRVALDICTWTLYTVRLKSISTGDISASIPAPAMVGLPCGRGSLEMVSLAQEIRYRWNGIWGCAMGLLTVPLGKLSPCFQASFFSFAKAAATVLPSCRAVCADAGSSLVCCFEEITGQPVEDWPLVADLRGDESGYESHAFAGSAHPAHTNSPLAVFITLQLFFFPSEERN